MLGALANGKTIVRGFLRSDDCLATLDAFRSMGITTTERSDGTLEIEGRGLSGLREPAQALDLGNSGTALRLLMGVLASQSFDTILSGDESLRSRPMERIAAPLRSMGAHIDTQGGSAPVHIYGGASLQGLSYRLPVASAQIKSALLLATLQASGETTLTSPGPSRDHTERMLVAMGVKLETDSTNHTVRLQGPSELNATTIDVPGDLSSAAFFIVAACLAADDSLTIKDVGVNATRSGVLTVLKAMGAQIELENRRELGAEPIADIRVRRSQLKGIDVPSEWVPLAIDELPVLFVAAAAASGTTIFRGAEELRHKESDRLGAMARALRVVGVRVEEQADGLTIHGGGLSGGVIETEGDHRIAMAFVVASLVSDGAIEILDTAPVKTSFPDFVKVASGAGLNISVREGQS